MVCKRKHHTAPIYIHKKAFDEFYGADKNGKPDKNLTTGISWIAEQKTIEDRLIYTKGPVWISENIVIAATLPNHRNNDSTDAFYIKNHDGIYSLDFMDHEQFLAVEEKGNIYVFSGCSHKGILEVIDYTKILFPDKKLRLLVAGMHLFLCNSSERKRIIQKISESELEAVVPLHCTGLDAIYEMKECMGDRCIILSGGDQIEI